MSKREAAIVAALDAQQQASDMFACYQTALQKSQDALRRLRSVLPGSVGSDEAIHRWVNLSMQWHEKASELSYYAPDVKTFYPWHVRLRTIQATERCQLRLMRQWKLAAKYRGLITARCEALMYSPMGAWVQMDRAADQIDEMDRLLDSIHNDCGFGYDRAGAGVDLDDLRARMKRASGMVTTGAMRRLVVQSVSDFVSRTSAAFRAVQDFYRHVGQDLQLQGEAERQITVMQRRITATRDMLRDLTEQYGLDGTELSAGLDKAHAYMAQSRIQLAAIQVHQPVTPGIDWRMGHAMVFEVLNGFLRQAGDLCHQITLAQRQLERPVR